MTPDSSHEPSPLALLGHELRTPLNAVLGYADAMRCEVFGPLPAPYRDQAGLIHTAASHLLALVDAMTATGAAGGRPLFLEPLGSADLEILLAQSVGLLAPRAASSNLQLRISSLDPPAIMIRADRIALSQILINLIDNAVKFTAAGGTITVGVERAGKDVRFSVENGGGAGRATGGTGQGLGLELVRALVEAMGGALNLDLSDNHARAVVCLPAITDG